MIQTTVGAVPTAKSRARAILSFHLPLAVLLFALVVLLQWNVGAYVAEFGSHPDEAAHYVTGLLVRDYIAQGFPGNPIAFAERYYDHYPKVALGNWPPLFYIIQAAWTLPFTPNRMSILLLMAVLTALTALAVALALRRAFGWTAAAFGSLLFVGFNQTQQYASMVMTEMPVALFSCLAILAFGRYLDYGKTRDSVLFGVLASAAIMTKGSGLVLALVPPLAILFTGRFHLVKRLNLWYAFVIVLVLAGPWTYAFRDVARAGWEEHALSLNYTLRGLTFFPRHMLYSSSLIVSGFALIGIVVSLRAARRREAAGYWAAATAVVLGTIIFHSIIPASLDYRHLMQALPAWALLATAGVVAVHSRVAATAPRFAVVVILIAIGGLLHTGSRFGVKRGSGFGTVVEEIVKRPQHANSRFLVASDATGEGMFIAETAMRESRPGHVIKRASKVLSQQAWHGGGYFAKAQNAEQVLAALKKEQIRVVVFDDSNPMHREHTRLLRSVAENNPNHLTLVATYPIARGYPRQVRDRTFPNGISVYEVR